MADDSDTLIPVYLRRIDAKLDTVIKEIRDLERRMTSFGTMMARMAGDTAALRRNFAGPRLRMDHRDRRPERIEHRLALQGSH